MKRAPQTAAPADDDLPDEILELARLLADVSAAEQTAPQPPDQVAGADR